MKYIDSFLNSITMYRLVLYGLFILVFFGIAFSFLGILPMNGWQMVISFFVLTITAYVTNMVLGYLFRVPLNSESASITALILFLIMPPPVTLMTGLFLTLAAAIAMAGKFLLNVKGKHLFNPAALGAFAVGLAGLIYPTWWVGSMVMLPAVAILGFLVVRKIRRFDLVITFLLVAGVSTLARSLYFEESLLETLSIAILSGPIVFFAAIMLTEPLTSPPTKTMRLVYGAVVALLVAIPYNIGPVYSTPELALILGNVFAYFVSPKQRLILRLKEKLQLAPMVYDFVFTPNQKMAFTAGQYMEWTINHPGDGRGNRRFFTIASAPSESDIHLGVKVPKDHSAFKKVLLEMKPGDELMAGGLSGEFNLPKDPTKKIVAIAGGVGITPFRSMVKEMINLNQKRDFVLLYVSADEAEFVYKDVFTAAEPLGVKSVYVLSAPKDAPLPEGWTGRTGFITKEMVEEEVGDYKDRVYFISGPPGMVEAYKKMLTGMGVSRNSIKTDYFPGY